jgi:superfamily II DNA or RNA helicase
MECHRKERLRNGGFRDYGLDGLAITKSGAFIGIQAKAYGPNSTITMSILGTFAFAINSMRDVNLESSGILVHTPDARFVERLAIFLERGSGNISRKALPFTGEIVRCESNSTCEEPSIVLRPYQVRAVDDITNCKDKVALYVSPCGTGKTLVIGTVLSRTRPNVVIVASPLQVSAEQNANRLSMFLPRYYVVRAWSEAGLTTLEDIHRELDKSGDFFFISTTFKTLPVVAEALKNNVSGYTLVIDEAHNLDDDRFDDESCDEIIMEIDTDEDMSVENSDECMSDENTEDSQSVGSEDSGQGVWDAVRSANRVILMTATPSEFMLEKNSDIVLAHKYSFGEAISDGAICDYKLYIPEISKRNTESTIEFDGQYETSIAAKASFLVSGMLESGSHRCIVYCGSREECCEFQEALRQTCDTYYGVGCVSSSITCDTPVRNRDEILRSFRKDPCFETAMIGEIEHRKPVLRVITSIRILDEAIDIPECDSVFITKCNGRESGPLAPARAVQRICRATRIFPGKTQASVFVWTLDAGEDSGLVRVFSLLRENDVKFASNIVGISRNYDRKSLPEAKLVTRKTVANFNDTFLVRAVTLCEAWNKKLENLIEFVAANDRLPMTKEKPLGKWIHKQSQNYKKGKISQERIVELEFIDGWIWEAEDTFPLNVTKLIDFVAGNDRLPTAREKPLGDWIMTQRQNYRKGKIRQNKIKMLEAVDKWAWYVF